LVRTVKAGEVLKTSDVVMERRPKSEVRGDGVSAADAVGLAARVAMRAGAVIRTDDLIRPQVVQRNESVTITYEVPGITLTAPGKATEAGAVGDVIGILNVQSNRSLQATVIGLGRVSIAAAIPIAANAAPVVAAAAESEESKSPRTQ